MIFSRMKVSIFLKPDVTADQRSSLQNDLKADPLVKEVTYESRDDAYKRFKEQFKDAPDLVNATKPDSLPESFRVKLKDPKKVQSLTSEFANREGISEIVDQQQLLSKVFSILGAMQNLALVVASVQGVAALLLVANTIQVAAFSKRREVAVMKLVGASNWFVRVPFMAEGLVQGAIGFSLRAGKLQLQCSCFRVLRWHHIDHENLMAIALCDVIAEGAVHRV